MAAKEISVKKYVVRLSGEERERLETCELRQRLPENLRVPNNTGAASDGVVKRRDLKDAKALLEELAS